MTQIGIKSTEKQFPIFNKDGPKVALSDWFQKALSCSVFSKFVQSGLFPKFFELLVNVWFANCDFFLDRAFKTLRDSCQAMFYSRDGEGLFLGKSKGNVLLDV